MPSYEIFEDIRTNLIYCIEKYTGKERYMEHLRISPCPVIKHTHPISKRLLGILNTVPFFV